MEENPYSPPQESEEKTGSQAAGIGLASILAALTASGLFMLIGLSARFERPGRYREVHWDGPIGEWVVSLEVFGWLLAVTALVLGAAAVESAKSGKRIDRLLGLIGLGLVTLNVIGHCLFVAALAESQPAVGCSVDF